VPSVEPLEERWVPSCTVRLSGDVLTIRGGGSAHNIRILDNGTSGAGAVSARCDGRTFQASGAVRVIQVRTGGGNDRIDYALSGNVAAGAQRIVDINPGGGRNTFTFELNGSLQSRAALALRYNGGGGADRVTGTVRENLTTQASLVLVLNGGGGADRLNVDATGSTVGFASALVANVGGSAGNDTVGFTYSGGDQGVISARIAGDNGNDRASADITITNNQGGTFRPIVSTQVTGGNGRDNLRLALRRTKPTSPLLLNTTLDGGPGQDTGAATADVLVLNVERLTRLS
jgi:hypothetical protein